MKIIKKINLLVITSVLFSTIFFAQVDNAKVYWVGHSLISHTDNYTTGSFNLIELINTFTTHQGKTYNYYQHTTPGAPLGWNWGANTHAWNDIKDLIEPLINSSHIDYGTFNTMVLTEGINVNTTYDYWASSFYARKFYNAAKKANPNTRLFLYESWHHYNAADEEYRDYYGPMATFNWSAYMISMRTVWENIIDKASNPAETQNDANYTYLGSDFSATDPGLGNDILDIKIIPTGRVLVKVFERLNEDLASDDWSYKGDVLKTKDFFANPLSNFPTNLTTKVHPEDPLDDIHPSNVLVYLNSLVHYAVIYQDNPINLPTANDVPTNISSIFKEIVWSEVLDDERTGVSQALSVYKGKSKLPFKIYPNPSSSFVNISKGKNIKYTITDFTGKIILKGKEKNIDISQLSNGIYILKTNYYISKFIKK